MTNTERRFDLASFQKANAAMIATNNNTYGNSFDRQFRSRVRDYSPEEIQKIIDSGSISEQQKLSRNYFYKDGYYKQILIHYATLLKYAGLLIPNPGFGKNLSTPHIAKRYYNALDFIEQMSLPNFLTNCAIRALIDGSYYGIVLEMNKNNFSVLDLPSGYCVSRYKDFKGNDIIEFDLSYFNSIIDKDSKQAALAAYPKIITDAYRKWSRGKRTSKWVIIPSEIGICFPFFDGRPLFLNVIPATIQYDQAVENEQEKDAEEIRKIIVQKIPHLTDGRLLFEPDEAEEMHAGTVAMLKGNKNVSVLTTYGEVDAIVSKGNADTQNNTLERMLKNIYSQAGVSGELFASNGSNTLETSLKNDTALMMYLANKFSHFITYVINQVHSNTNINFKYTILPITYYNEDKYVDTAFKLASSGYSFLMPAVAMGLSQKDIVNIKDLENDVLDLGEKLKPLISAYTQSGEDEGGRPKKEGGEKADKTVRNEESKHKTEGGSE